MGYRACRGTLYRKSPELTDAAITHYTIRTNTRQAKYTTEELDYDYHVPWKV
jgi:hypothetical protein